jgi:hypothetical protein
MPDVLSAYLCFPAGSCTKGRPETLCLVVPLFPSPILLLLNDILFNSLLVEDTFTGFFF